MPTKSFKGRGNKAPYEQTHMRIPLPIKPQVEILVAEFREQALRDAGISESGLSKPSEVELPQLPSKDEAIAKAHEIAKESKKGSKHLLQLVEWIYG